MATRNVDEACKAKFCFFVRAIKYKLALIGGEETMRGSEFSLQKGTEICI